MIHWEKTAGSVATAPAVFLYAVFDDYIITDTETNYKPIFTFCAIFARQNQNKLMLDTTPPPCYNVIVEGNKFRFDSFSR